MDYKCNGVLGPLRPPQISFTSNKVICAEESEKGRKHKRESHVIIPLTDEGKERMDEYATTYPFPRKLESALDNPDLMPTVVSTIDTYKPI